MAISLYTSSPKEEEEKEEKTFTNTKIASKETMNGAWEDPRGPAQHLTQSFRIHFID
jgi:hypothetical protein